MLLVSSSSVVLLLLHSGEMPPCLICAYVIAALCVGSLVLWTLHIISSFVFNDAHSAECSLSGLYGLLGRRRLPHEGCTTAAWLSENTVISCENVGYYLLIRICVDRYSGCLTCTVGWCTCTSAVKIIGKNPIRFKVAPVNLLRYRNLNCKCKFPF